MGLYGCLLRLEFSRRFHPKLVSQFLYVEHCSKHALARFTSSEVALQDFLGTAGANLASSIACDPCRQDVVLVSAERLPEGFKSFPAAAHVFCGAMLRDDASFLCCLQDSKQPNFS